MNRDLPTITLPDATGVLAPHSAYATGTSGGQQSARNLLHFAELFRLADQAGLLRDPDLACARMRHLLALHGVEG